MREMVLEEPNDPLDEAFEREEVEYRKLKDFFDKSGAADKHALADRPKIFISPEEYAVFRREYSIPFFRAWTELLRPGSEEAVEHTTEIDGLLSKSSQAGNNPQLLSKKSSQAGNNPLLNGHEPYWRAVAELYGAEMGEVFGGVQVVEKGLLPMGMVDLFKGKVRWEA